MMKNKSNPFIAILFIFIIFGCKKPCEESLRIGEIVQIPISFIGFNISELDNILVFRINNSNPNSIDSFLLREILWANTARSANEIITDREPNKAQIRYGQYESYFDNCTLIFNWNTGKDSLLNIEIKKSKEKIKGCHENDPNVKIDLFSFVHNGRLVSKGESISIFK